tara:strand:- start:21269 stop:22375 length:1107 start_codon:yes stop_codon:yes gene_type:complete
MHINIDRIFTTVSRNLGLIDYANHIQDFVEWTYEAEKLIGSRDTFLQKEATYNSTGAKASATITFSDVPAEGDSITLNGVKLYFKSSSNIGQAYLPNELTIQAGSLSSTLDLAAQPYGLIQSLKGGSGSGGTTGKHMKSAIYNYPELLDIAEYSVDTTTGVLTITAKEIGHEGNDYTLACDGENIEVSSNTLTGGKGKYSNQQLVLPEDNIKLLSVRVGAGDALNKNSDIRKTSSVHRGRVGVQSNNLQRAFRYYLEGNRLNITHDNLQEITISYLKYPTDPRGYPMVKEGHETAVAQYIMWQMKLIEFYNGKIPQYITKELEKRWYFLCGKARGDDSMPTSQEIKQIGKLWNTLVPISNDSNSLLDL